LCFGIYKEGSEETYEQVGFARVITDLATFAYLCDVFVLPSYRGLGLSKWLMDVITNHPELKGVRRIMLATNDAHSLYTKYGFEQIDTPQLFMQITRKNIYK
jgi:GNAT superfamily N-acetyltransferase